MALLCGAPGPARRHRRREEGAPSACTRALSVESSRRRVRLLLLIAAPVALSAPTPDTHQQHILTAWEAGTPATWKGFAERPSPVAATATAAGDAARATRAATLAAIQAAGREAAAEPSCNPQPPSPPPRRRRRRRQRRGTVTGAAVRQGKRAAARAGWSLPEGGAGRRWSTPEAAGLAREPRWQAGWRRTVAADALAASPQTGRLQTYSHLPRPSRTT